MSGLTCENVLVTELAPFILYSRPGCHLCERVEQMLERSGVNWLLTDIEDDQELERRFGLEIPVVEDSRAKKMLFFPFGEEQLMRFLMGGNDSET